MNRIIRQASIIGLFILAVTVGANAQAQQYRAQVPFNFEANGKDYSAGEYTLGPVGNSSSNAIAIRGVSKGSDSGLLGILAQPGTDNWDQPNTLTFLKIGDRYTLVRVSTATFRMNMKKGKARHNELAASDSARPEMVSVKLNK